MSVLKHIINKIPFRHKYLIMFQYTLIITTGDFEMMMGRKNVYNLTYNYYSVNTKNVNYDAINLEMVVNKDALIRG